MPQPEIQTSMLTALRTKLAQFRLILHCIVSGKAYRYFLSLPQCKMIVGKTNPQKTERRARGRAKETSGLNDVVYLAPG
ncbi:hypothetical protein FOQG_19588 [Fusarium oxysporum f. sp. raphani 54005]|uniref:Uncharacterized protein n=1 Tax=Fusarium oxysporum f. sp. raphani 54005 TaxID=1089458 RepID=X0BYN2_FUSOX|nr:hypothetical protein FOQG_19588 [Fusarium oxysporum f. sp. raphani 54005]